MLDLPRRVDAAVEARSPHARSARCAAARMARRIVPGNAEQSRLYRASPHLDAIKMPMHGDALEAGRDRRDEALDRSGRAVGRGARRRRRRPAACRRARSRRSRPWTITPEQRNYWAFKLPVQAPLPRGGQQGLSRIRSIAFSRRRASRAGLTAAPRADRCTLVRRAYLDLLGLPPTPAQVAARSSPTTRPEAWERLIDTLLASPHYGERWGRHWLDVARYADSGGFEHDIHRAQRLALSRLRHQVVQRRQALRPVPERADRRRRDGLARPTTA